MLGLSVMLTGKGDAPGGLWPPHAGKNKNNETAKSINADEPKHNLPMHPLVASRLYRMGATLTGMENL
ncbi:MAG: hypothetical protein WB660_17305 [Candidatus Sulfotelmatobacter sp.]